MSSGLSEFPIRPVMGMNSSSEMATRFRRKPAGASWLITYVARWTGPVAQGGQRVGLDADQNPLERLHNRHL